MTDRKNLQVGRPPKTHRVAGKAASELFEGCEQQQRLLDEQQLAMSDSAKAAVPEIGVLVSAAGSTDTSVSPIRADAGSPSAGLIMRESKLKVSTSKFPPPGKYGIRPTLCESTKKPVNGATMEMQLQEAIIHAYDNGPCNHKQKEAIFRVRLLQIQNEKEQRERTDIVRQQSEQTQQTPISQVPISTPLTPHTSPDGGSGDSISLLQEARKLDAIKKVNETRKRNRKKETKRETKIATHASTLSSALAKVKEDETSEKSIEMPDRKSQPLKCGICKEAFTSLNALFKHLYEEHEFYREWQQQPEVEEKTSPRACDGSHINPCPAASSWQIQRKGRGSSAGSKRSNALTSKTTRLPHVNSFAALYEPDEDECNLPTGDDQIKNFAVFCEHDKAAIAPPSPRYIAPSAGPFRVAIMRTAVHHSDLLERTQLSTT